MQRITSLQNARVAALRALKEKKERESSGLFLVEGSKMVEEALAHAAVSCVVVEEEDENVYAGLIALCAARAIDVLAVPHRVLAAVCDVRTPQGIAAAVALPPHGVQDSTLAGMLDAPARWVALDGVQDPGNVGTIVRTADAAGFTGVLLGAGCADPYGAKTLRATMGSIFRVPIHAAADLAATLGTLRARGWAVLCSELGGHSFYARGALPPGQVLVVGSEGAGISPQVSAQATHRLALPMRGGAESLNAAVAAGIMLYEMARAAGEEESCPCL